MREFMKDYGNKKERYKYKKQDKGARLRFFTQGNKPL